MCSTCKTTTTKPRKQNKTKQPSIVSGSKHRDDPEVDFGQRIQQSCLHQHRDLHSFFFFFGWSSSEFRFTAYNFMLWLWKKSLCGKKKKVKLTKNTHLSLDLKVFFLEVTELKNATTEWIWAISLGIEKDKWNRRLSFVWLLVVGGIRGIFTLLESLNCGSGDH